MNVKPFVLHHSSNKFNSNQSLPKGNQKKQECNALKRYHSKEKQADLRQGNL